MKDLEYRNIKKTKPNKIKWPSRVGGPFKMFKAFENTAVD